MAGWKSLRDGLREEGEDVGAWAEAGGPDDQAYFLRQHRENLFPPSSRAFLTCAGVD